MEPDFRKKKRSYEARKAKKKDRNLKKKITWCHRKDFPFVLTEVDPDVDDDPFVLLLSFGFFNALLSDGCTRGVDSFITIFAWISSSLEAFTFFGQNRVTNLSSSIFKKTTVDMRSTFLTTYVHRCRLHLSQSSPFACFACNTASIRRPIAARESLRIATLSSLGISSPESLSCFLGKDDIRVNKVLKE